MASPLGALSPATTSPVASPFVGTVMAKNRPSIMFFFSPIASIIGNMIGMKWVILFGTLGYVPYSTALYCNSKLGTQWFLLFGATTCGLSVGCRWIPSACITI
jgi:hypothetical protein